MEWEKGESRKVRASTGANSLKPVAQADGDNEIGA